MLDFQKYRQAFLEASQSISNEQWSDYANNPFFPVGTWT